MATFVRLFDTAGLLLVIGCTPPPSSPPAPSVADGAASAPLPQGGVATRVPAPQGAELAIAAAGAKVAGMQPVATTFAGEFRTGQTLEQPFEISAGKCYAVVAVGVPVEGIAVEIVSHSPPLPPLLVMTASGGKETVLGGEGGCYRSPLALDRSAKVILRATAGAGIIAARIYAK